MILTTLHEMFTGKKFLGAVAGTIVAAALKIGLELDTESVLLVISPIVSYILGQGWADTGKEAAKINREAAQDRVGY